MIPTPAVSPASIIFLGSKKIGYLCLARLLSEDFGRPVHIKAVFTAPPHPLDDPEKSISALCERYHIPVHTTLAAMDEMEEADFIISVQYHLILRPAHLGKARHLAINLHLAPLPEYRGCNQFSFAILDEKKEFGVTLHAMTPRPDAGDILFEKRFDIPAQCLVKELYALTLTAALELFTESMPHLLAGNYTPVPQDSLIALRGTSYHLRNEIEDIKKLDLAWSPEKIALHIRATWFPPYDPPYFEWAGKKFPVSLTQDFG